MTAAAPTDRSRRPDLDRRDLDRRGLARRAGVLAVLLLPACGADGGTLTPVGKAELGTTTVATDRDDPGDAGDAGAPTTTGAHPTSTTVPSTPDAALGAAVAAYRSELGESIRALQLTVWFPASGTPYAELQSQDPSTPTNVNSRRWANGSVEGPEPVRLTGDGSLEANLFSIGEIDWAAIAAGLAGAPALVEQKLGTAIENGRGVTHVIATKDLPFTSNTVVRVYVDGGDRTTGGYVEYLADGSVGEVQA